MKKLPIHKIKTLSLVFGITISLLASRSFAAGSRSLTVFTEPNAVAALTEIAREFSQKTNTIVSVNFDLSPDLLSDIDSGDPMDVLISAHPELIESLKQKGLVDVHNAGYIAADRLALVTSGVNGNAFSEMKKNTSLEEALEILNQKNAELLIDHRGNSSGRFADEFLRNRNLPALRLLNKISEDKSPILSIARKNTTLYALLLASQIKNEKDFVILAEKSEADVFYQALVIAGDNMDVAREFVKFLKTDAAESILTKAGFKALGQN